MDSIKIAVPDVNGIECEGVIRRLNYPNDSLDFFINWLPAMWDLAGKPLFPDSHWEIVKIWGHLSKSPDYRIFVLDIGKQVQGYIVIRIKGYIGVDKRENIHISFLSSAPWNRNDNTGLPVYRHIGLSLIRFAVIAGSKYTENLAIELSSLPGAEFFYNKIGFVNTGFLDKERLPVYRLEAQGALKLARPLLRKFFHGRGDNDGGAI